MPTLTQARWAVLLTVATYMAGAMAAEQARQEQAIYQVLQECARDADRAMHAWAVAWQAAARRRVTPRA
jgi:hypothetical protein